jgi:hypothetical protein
MLRCIKILLQRNFGADTLSRATLATPVRSTLPRGVSSAERGEPALRRRNFACAR